MIFIGIDPGTGGALAKYHAGTGHLEIIDMPSWQQSTGRGKANRRVDPVGLRDYFEWAKLEGVALVVLEAVGGRPQQTQTSGFQLGYACGLIYMACVASRLPIETVSPQVWKRHMKMPGKVARISKAESPTIPDGERKAVLKQRNDDQAVAIIRRAEELFPEYSNLFRGPQGGFKLDRAEAAALAKYAAIQSAGMLTASGGREPVVDFEG